MINKLMKNNAYVYTFKNFINYIIMYSNIRDIEAQINSAQTLANKINEEISQHDLLISK